MERIETPASTSEGGSGTAEKAEERESGSYWTDEGMTASIEKCLRGGGGKSENEGPRTRVGQPKMKYWNLHELHKNEVKNIPYKHMPKNVEISNF